MRKILILSLLFALIAGSAEARQSPWEHYLPIDEMTRKKDYSREKVLAGVDIEGLPWDAHLHFFCENGSLTFVLRQYGGSDYKSVKLDREEGIAPLRIKFDNNEPFFTPWKASEADPGNVSLYDNFIPVPEIGNIPDNRRDEIIKMRDEIIKMRKRIIKGMIKYRRLWIGFEVKNTPYIAKFDLTGFSRELAKCSKIPDTN